VHNLQQIETVVNGPDGANRLFLINGQCDTFFGIQGSPNGNQSTATFGVLVGPVLTRQQFYKAIASASISRTNENLQAVPAFGNFGISDIDADWDDESGQVQVKIEIFISLGGAANNGLNIQGLAFQVSILAALPTA